MKLGEVQLRRAGYEDIPKLMEEALESAEYDFANRTVLIKPNLLGPYPPNRHVTTQPILIEAALESLLRRGAKPIVGDNCGISGYGSFMRTAKTTGVAEAAGRYLENIAGDTVIVHLKELDIDVPVSRAVLEVDFVLNLAVAKTHTLSFITAAVKNTFGYIAGAGKAQLHHQGRNLKAFGTALADVFAIRPPEFSFVDGIVAMQGNGPSGSSLISLNTVLWGRDAAAVDATLCRFLGIKVESIPTLQEVNRRKLGMILESEITILGDNPEPPSRFKMPITYGGGFARVLTGIFNPMNNLLFRMLNPRPRIDSKICVRCGDCRKICPEAALEEVPNINYDKCIRCYCCKEACTHEAIKLGGLVRYMQGRDRN